MGDALENTNLRAQCCGRADAELHEPSRDSQKLWTKAIAESHALQAQSLDFWSWLQLGLHPGPTQDVTLRAHFSVFQTPSWDAEAGRLQHTQVSPISSLEPCSGHFRVSVPGASGSSSSKEPRSWLGMGVPGALPTGTAAGGGNSHRGLALLRGSLCQRRQKVRSASNLDRVRERLPFWLCFLLRNRFFPLRMQKIDSLAGHIAEASHVQMVCTSAFFTALV